MIAFAAGDARLSPISPRSAPAIATGAKLSVWPLPRAFDRAPAGSLPTRLSSQRVRRCGGSLAQPRGTGLHHLARQLRHARGRRVRARREGEDVRGNDVAIVEQFQGVQRHLFSFGRKSGDEVGADGRVRRAQP